MNIYYIAKLLLLSGQKSTNSKWKNMLGVVKAENYRHKVMLWISVTCFEDCLKGGRPYK